MSIGHLKLRPARLEDTSKICDIHKSHIKKWYRRVGEEEYELPYSALSLSERWGYGGPWMSIETCAIHLNNMLLRRQYPVVAQHGRGIPGEMEAFLGREGPRYGKNLHIGLLYVKRGFTGKGIGSKLVENAVKLAVENDCDSLTVSSSQANEGFYEKCGFKMDATLVDVEAATKAHDIDIKPIQAPKNIQSLAWGMNMPVGRYQSSAYHLFEQHDAYAIPEFANCKRWTDHVAVKGIPSMFIFTEDEAERATVYGWTDGAKAGDMVFAALSLLYEKGIKYANILLSRDDYDTIAGSIDAAIKGSRSSLIYEGLIK